MTSLDSLTKESIERAVRGDWKKAVQINKQILKLNSQNLDANLRLGFAYLQSGDIKNSKKAYLRALRNQPNNQIAKSNLEKIKILEKKGARVSGERKNEELDPNLFLNILGKTRVIALINIGQANTLARLKIGQEVQFKIKRRRVEVRDKSGVYVGALPDDISKRMRFFLEAMSQFRVYIKESSKNIVEIFIKEEKLGRKVRKYISFPKNLRDDLKFMIDEEVNSESSERVDEEDIDDSDGPVDIEKLAEEVAEAEIYPETAVVNEDEETDYEE